MAKRKTYLGSIALTALVHETRVVAGKKGIFIPIDENPSIYFQQKEDGTKIINLDVEVRPTPNSKYGNSHFVKASVGKASREKHGLRKDQLERYTPIIGNLREFEFEIPEGTQSSPAAQSQGGYGGEDLPAELDGAW